MRLLNSASHCRQLTFGVAFSSSQRFSFQILVFDKVAKCNVGGDEHHSNECDSMSKCTNLNTIMWSFEPKPLFLLMSEKWIRVWCGTLMYIFNKGVLCVLSWRRSVMPASVAAEKMPLSCDVFYAQRWHRLTFLGLFFQVLLSIGLMCLTCLVLLYHTFIKQGFYCSGVSEVYGEGRAHQPQLGNR